MAAIFSRLALAYSLDQIRGLEESLARHCEVVLIPGRSRWLYVPSSREDDDGVDWLLPTWTSEEDDGRWGRWQISSDSGSGVTLPIAESDVTGLVADLASLAGAIVTEASDRATADALLVPKARVITTTTPLKIAGAGSADLSADRTLSIDDATTGAKGVVILATPSADVTAGHVVQASDARLSDARTPLTHTHPESDITSLVSDLAAKEATANKDAVSGYAGLDASQKVIKDPANATATPTASKIPISSAGGKLDSWISDAAAGVKGLIELDTDLGGTASAPKVVAITETSGPTQLVIGSIADGQFVKRDGSTLKGVSSSAVLADDDLLGIKWDRSWFTSESLLPATKKFEAFGAWPAWDGVPSSGTMTVRRSLASYVAGANGLTAWWDLGGLKSKVLILIGSIASSTAGTGVFIADAAPTGVEIVANGYLFGCDSTTTGVYTMYKRGTFTSLGAGIGHGGGSGVGIYYDDTANKLIGLLRASNGQWYPSVEVTESSFTTMRYVGIRSFGGSYQAACPVVVYYTT